MRGTIRPTFAGLISGRTDQLAHVGQPARGTMRVYLCEHSVRCRGQVILESIAGVGQQHAQRHGMLDKPACHFDEQRLPCAHDCYFLIGGISPASISSPPATTSSQRAPGVSTTLCGAPPAAHHGAGSLALQRSVCAEPGTFHLASSKIVTHTRRPARLFTDRQIDSIIGIDGRSFVKLGITG